MGPTTHTEDLKICHERAIAADPYNSKILRQLDLYQQIDRNSSECNASHSSISSSPSYARCILCIGNRLCPFCQLKNDFRDLLSPNDNESMPILKMSSLSLDTVASLLLKAER
mmetsp:Transcript_27726/g.32332  ORF Transcript_27726/g.32332 Transcript_27726/m.32332 type:complete len:113 (-) Transcript_27726:190-528(-)